MVFARRAIRARTRPMLRRRDGVTAAPTWMRGRGQTIRCLVIALGFPATRVLQAQGRELKSYGPGAPEAKLMLYYSSTVAFSPLGAPLRPDSQSQPLVAVGLVEGRGTLTTVSVASRAPRLEASIEVSYLPH